jgi:hypothetical protein
VRKPKYPLSSMPEPSTPRNSEPSPEGRKSFLLRINAGLWKELEAWSQEELRSVNGQIEFILRAAVQKRKGSAAHPKDGAGV